MQWQGKCEESVVNNPSRMEMHALKCNAEENKNAPQAKQLKQSTWSVMGTSASKQHAIDLQNATFVLATNSSFLTVENQHFQQVVQMLRPGTTVPNRKKVSGDFLDEKFQTERNKVNTSIQGAIATLAIDEWSTLTNEPVIGICFMSGNECYLANTVNTTGELSPLETATVIEYLKMFGEAILPELTKYLGQVAPYSSYLFLDSYKAVNPCAWWRRDKTVILQNFRIFYQYRRNV